MKLNNNDDSHNSGLNLLIYNMLLDIESHPAWVCGLKHRMETGCVPLSQVTPCVGVWIETCRMAADQFPFLVTPCVGVWIETASGQPCNDRAESHPAWVCGLKHLNLHGIVAAVASHPAWVCGLKPSKLEDTSRICCVTPCVGVWIETP